VLPYPIWSFCITERRHKYRRTQNIRDCWNSALFGWEAWLTPIYTLLPDMCHHVKFGSSVIKDVCINRKNSQSWGVLGPRALAVGASVTTLKIFSPFPTWVILPILVVLGQMVRALLMRSA